MPVKQQQRQQVNTFVGGFITEASPLNFPDTATRYEQNFEIDRKGFRRRRLGMSLTKVLIERTEAPIEDVSFKTFIWEGVGGNSSLDYLLMLVGRELYVFDYNDENYPLIKKITLSIPNTSEVSFSSVNGKLIMVNGGGNILVFEQQNQDITFTTGRLRIRDLWGVEDSPEYERDPNYRGALTRLHRYNLQNQSWGIPRFSATSNSLQDPIYVYYSRYGRAPANSEQVWHGMQMQPVTAQQQPFEKMFSLMYEQVLGMYPESARGYFVIDALNRGSSREEEVSRNLDNYPNLTRYSPNLPEDRVTGGATVVAGFAGRLFYSGFTGGVSGADARSVDYYDAVLFSQQVNATGDVFKCYQEGDPTSREGHDVVDTDGGLIKISGMHGVLSMIPIGTNLVVFSRNGVWTIKGGGNYGFTATNYSVEKLSTFGCISKESVVAVGEEIYYWSEDGIYVVSRDQYGDFVVNNITIGKIHSFFNDIPRAIKERVIGEHSVITKEISWLFTQDGITTELKLDIVLGAFSVHKIPYVGNQRIRGLFSRKGVRFSETDLKVSVGFDTVSVGGDEVIVQGAGERSVLPSYEYVVCCSETFSIALANKQSPDYKDWGVFDAEGILETGELTAGDITLEKQINYLDVFVKREEEYTQSGVEGESACNVSARWNFANSMESGEWTLPESAYRINPLSLRIDNGRGYSPFDVQKTRVNIRGTGQAVSLQFSTEEGKDCEILGWSITWTGNPIS